jgi:hypothetical protein
MAERDVAPLVARVSEVVAARLEEVAAEAGVSYHTLYAWGRGRRNASARHLLRLAQVVRERAALLEQLAGELEAHAAELAPVRVKAGANGSTRRARPPADGVRGDGVRAVAPAAGLAAAGRARAVEGPAAIQG